MNQAKLNFKKGLTLVKIDLVLPSAGLNLRLQAPGLHFLRTFT